MPVNRRTDIVIPYGVCRDALGLIQIRICHHFGKHINVQLIIRPFIFQNIMPSEYPAYIKIQYQRRIFFQNQHIHPDPLCA